MGGDRKTSKTSAVNQLSQEQLDDFARRFSGVLR